MKKGEEKLSVFVDEMIWYKETAREHLEKKTVELMNKFCNIFRKQGHYKSQLCQLCFCAAAVVS